ncbi:MAG: hypothetical protein NTX96_00775 [Candidatus Zambryskibacteria bacterium]|nr:hypothetical protein [Candidatus Zambryskibacteria bacterium]
MYKSRSADYYRTYIGFPESYIVSGFLSCGTWDEETYLKTFLLMLDKLNLKYDISRPKGFWNKIIEIKINNKIIWFTMLYGGATLSEYTHIACLFGSQKNIHIGSCGGLFPEMNSSDLLIPTWSYGDDSVTRTYSRNVQDNRHYPDKTLTEKIKSKIDPKCKVWQGPIITCQAMLGETEEDIQNWSKEGYFGVEMETATVFSVSNHYNVPSASLMYVSDNLIKGQTVGDESYEKDRVFREESKIEMFRVTTEAILND